MAIDLDSRRANKQRLWPRFHNTSTTTLTIVARVAWAHTDVLLLLLLLWPDLQVATLQVSL
jgi:hypothetical protein